MPPVRWFSTIVVALLTALAACGGALAQGSNTYTVTDVDVDVTGARRRAGAPAGHCRGAPQGRQDAGRSHGGAGRSRPRGDADDASLEGMVRGIEFVRERSAPGRYIATLNVVFSPDPVKAWLGEAGVKIAETVSRPALVIPLWKGKAGVEPLDDRNAWREAWRTLDTAGSAVPVTVIRGDQLDQNAVTAEEALCRRRLGARRGSTSAIAHRPSSWRSSRATRTAAADRRRPALRRADRRAQRDSQRRRFPTPASSPTRPSRSTPSSTSNGAASPRCAAICRTRSTSSCRSARSATGCRCASGWAGCRR